ncbi:KAT8 regulatory NSL complex subunit 1-like protein, partial [Silurus asotus]
MPPALDKTLEKDCRIHISPPVLTQDVDSSRDMDPQIKLVNDSYARFWLNRSSFSILDSCSIEELPAIPQQSMDHSSTFYNPDLQRNLGPLLGCVSMDKFGVDCPIIHEDSRFQEQSRKDLQNLTQTLSFVPYYQRDSEPCSSARSRDRSVALRPVWHLGSRNSVQEDFEARRRRLSSQHCVLTSRMGRAKLRLHALLGENALQTFNKQLEAMSKKLSSLSPTSSKTHPDTLHSAENTLQQGNTGPGYSSEAFSMEKSSDSIQLIRGIKSLAQRGQAVLRNAQQALDSDGTDISSDDEWDEKTIRKRLSSDCLGCEWRFQHDRSKLASQWTWMKLRLSELDLQIRKVSQLHQHLLANKGVVVLAEAQPLTDLQIQQTLLTETAGLTLTAGHKNDLSTELDTEPSSPTRLLRNIERQSAQLSQIVNSLMSPLNDSPSRCPLAKGDSRCWRGSRKRSFNSLVTDVFLPSGSTCIGKTSQKKRRVSRRGQLQSQVDVSRVCARTRPLLTYHKPRLFIMDQSPVTQQVTQSFSIHVSVSYRCSNTVSCDPMSVCSRPVPANTINSRFWPNMLVPEVVFSSNFFLSGLKRFKTAKSQDHTLSTEKKTYFRNLSCSIPVILKRLYPDLRPIKVIVVLSHFTESSVSHCVCPAFFKEDWVHQPRSIVLSPGFTTAEKQTSSIFNTFSPRAEDSLEDMSTPHSINLHQRKSQFAQRRRSDESIYNINNLVIPVSLVASNTVKKLQYKDIPTPRY